MQVFTVTGLFAGQHNTKLHGTITDDKCSNCTKICNQDKAIFLNLLSENTL